MPILQWRDVRLLSHSANSYREHQRHHTREASLNMGARIRDPKNLLTSWFEQKVRTELQRDWKLTEYRILRWDEYHVTRGYVARFQELDGVFEDADNLTIILEAKGSFSASSLTNAINKMEKTMVKVSKIRPRSIGIIVVGGLGKMFAGFSDYTPEILKDICETEPVRKVEWPVNLGNRQSDDRVFLSLVPLEILEEWLKECPVAYQDEHDQWQMIESY